jgi:hypothetical protein
VQHSISTVFVGQVTGEAQAESDDQKAGFLQKTLFQHCWCLAMPLY